MKNEEKRFKKYRSPAAILAGFAVLLFIGGVSGIFGSGGSDSEPADSDIAMTPVIPEGAETAVLAGGCFWGVEAVYEKLDGVFDVVSGYSGGSADTAHYNIVGTGTTGHAEAVQIMFDPEKISYETLLEVFFEVAHDPTQLNYQGPDVGTEYRSAVFYTNDEQKAATEKYISELAAKGAYSRPIVTEVIPIDEFYPAEDYHQDFMRLNPDHPYIVYWDAPKVEHLEKAFPELISDRK
jgi:peptide-methionine (S)-S-oxide reductase